MYRINEVKDRSVDELLGLCRGIIADGTVNQQEAFFLKEWIENNFTGYDLGEYPLNALYPRVRRMLEDGILDADEQKELFSLLKAYTGGTRIIEEISSETTTLPLDTPPPEVCINGGIFCLTGTFTIGTRGTVERLIRELGGACKRAPTKKTNYLVVGVLGSKDWIHTSYGRKIEAAVRFRELGSDIKIISEAHFMKFL